ncbi:shikimate dehydrogenase [Marinilactibacillus sp. GCM10026970]|uniref:shikimate dehydrogenase n=1 Tax=Marinilactibacillus sp. GCM10026970 TaxID=3252642 RepID=UPI0036176E99
MHFYGLFGESLSHTLSPALHKRIYQLLRIDAAYKAFAFKPALLEQAVSGVKALTINGVNVTIPYKEKVMPYLDEIDSFAEKLNAVNTIEHKNGKLIGHNTDYAGFSLIFQRRNWTIKDKTAVILGTGGAAKIVEAYLLDQGIEQLIIASRSPEKYEDTTKKTYTTYDSLSSYSGDYLINTTPVGMYPEMNDSPVDASIVEQFGTIIDLIYNPEVTNLLKMGNQLHKETANGLEMLVGQAVRAVEIWENCMIEDSLIDELIEYFQNELSESN